MSSFFYATDGVDQSKMMIYDFVPNSDYPYYKIGNIDLHKMEVMTYKGKIYKITIYLPPHTDILPLLKYRYGEHTKYDELVFPIYEWETSNGITCELMGYGGGSEVKTYLLKYEDRNIKERIKMDAEKQKEINQRNKERKLREQARTDF